MKDLLYSYHIGEYGASQAEYAKAQSRVYRGNITIVHYTLYTMH